MKQLVPFSSMPDLALLADIQRDSKQRLKIVFELKGEISQLKIPEKLPKPKRLNDLWKQTCFEIFLGPEKGTNYWEINLSPSGDWNAYAFEKYREGMKPERKIAGFQVQSQKTEKSFRLEATADLFNLNLNSAPMKLSVTAVLEKLDGKMSYWALQHSGKAPDFHLRESFIAQI